MAMERPVVTTRVGIARDVIEDGVSGIEIRGTDAASIREAIERALAGRDQWPRIGMEARRRALAFTPERWIRAHEQLYEAGVTQGAVAAAARLAAAQRGP